MTQASRRLPALLAAAGLLLSVVLEVVHVRTYLDPSASSFCSASASLDCASVALSSYSVILGVPLPVWGIAGFTAILVAAWTESAALLPLSAVAAVASVALLVLELTVIHSVCLLCEGVHVLSWALVFLAYKRRKDLRPITNEELPRIVGGPALALFAAFVFVPPYWGLYSWRQGVHVPHGVDDQGQPWIGAESPKLTVHEYVDYSCPHCALAATRTRKLLASHSTTLRVVRHQYPRMRCSTTAPTSCLHTRAALCASDQGKFWEADSWLFEHAPGKPMLDLAQLATDLKLDLAKLQACHVDPATYARGDAESVRAKKDKILEAPAYIIDGQRFFSKEAFPAIKSRL